MFTQLTGQALGKPWTSRSFPSFPAPAALLKCPRPRTWKSSLRFLSASVLHSLFTDYTVCVSLKLNTFKKCSPLVVREPCYAGKIPHPRCLRCTDIFPTSSHRRAFCSESSLCPQSSSLGGEGMRRFSPGVLFMSVHCHIGGPWRSRWEQRQRQPELSLGSLSLSGRQKVDCHSKQRLFLSYPWLRPEKGRCHWSYCGSHK